MARTVSNLPGLVEKLKALGVNAVVLFNRFYQLDIDVTTMEITSGPVFSHPADFSETLRWTAITSGYVPGFDIACSYGVHKHEDIVKGILAGATAMQLCSVLYEEGVEIVPEMLTFLEEWMSQNNYKNLSQFRGKLNYSNIPSPALYEFVQGFREYLDKDAKTKSNQNLSQNSKYSYFNKFRAALKQAVKDGIIPTNPSEGVEAFKQGEPQREFLTLEELQAAVQAECEIPQMKTAVIFSCLTGLRWSDINKLLWSEVQHSNEMGYYIRFRQKKTKGAETLPISEQAFGLLGERQDKDERVFKGLRYSAWYNLKLQQWMMRAGISKPITFHCARHTYATLQLTAGTDIYTVSKLLGHRELRTTQIYAKVIDAKKKEAANKIQLDL